MAEPRGVRPGLRLVGMMIRMHPAPFTVAVTGAALFAAAGVGATVIFGRVTDELVLPTFDGQPATNSDLVAAAAAIIGIAVLRVIGVVMRRYYAGMFTERVSRSLRQRPRRLRPIRSW